MSASPHVTEPTSRGLGDQAAVVSPDPGGVPAARPATSSPEGNSRGGPRGTYPPCAADAVALPAVGARVRHLAAAGRYGVVHGADPLRSTLLVLRDGAFFAETYPAADWEDATPGPEADGYEDDWDDEDDEDDGWDEHDADDALKDALYEDGLR